MPALIVAFDGVLADTLPLRAHVLADAAAAEFQPRSTAAALAVLPGRTLLEASLALFAAESERDPTLPELVALRAQRGYRQLVAHGVPVHSAVLDEMEAAGRRGDRVVVRADGERREVEPLLALLGLDHTLAFVRCSDDRPLGADASLVRSWQAIDGRLNGLRQPPSERVAWEPQGATTTAVAGEFAALVRAF
jgi:beta-phosphoglucomutase-like phosphatase (HAD superfamily)